MKEPFKYVQGKSGSEDTYFSPAKYFSLNIPVGISWNLVKRSKGFLKGINLFAEGFYGIEVEDIPITGRKRKLIRGFQIGINNSFGKY